MQQKVKIPAIGLIVLGILGVLSGLYSLFVGALDAQQLIDWGVPADQAEKVAKMLSGGGLLLNVVFLSLAAFVAWAGFRMLQLKSWTAAVIANILAMVPCVTSCCCVAGIPIGIWGLVVLFNPEVKRAFDQQVTPV